MELYSFVMSEKLFQQTEEPRQRVTRNTASTPFLIHDAKKASDIYIKCFWESIKKRLVNTDMSESSCVFSKAPAESIFSIYSRINKGCECLSIEHSVFLTRIAAHGPPVGTQDAALLSSKAMENFQSVHRERFCTALWTPGTTSHTVSNLVRKKWNWNC